jgi:hypothetical protein
MTSPHLGPEMNDGSGYADPPTFPATVVGSGEFADSTGPLYPDGGISTYPPAYPDAVAGTNPNAYPPSAYPPSAYPPNAYPPNAYLTNTYLPNAYLPARQTNVLAIISLTLVFFFWPAAIVCGHVARRQIKRSNESGRGLTTAALILGYGMFVFWLLVAGAAVIGAVTPG